MSNTIRFGMIEGGQDSDPDPQQGGRVRIRDIANHGPLVKTSDLPFSQMLSPTSGSGAFEFNRPPLPGTVVAYWTPEGAENTGYAFPIGIPHKIDSGGNGIPGNYSIPNVGKAIETLMNLPPEVQGLLQDNRTGIQKLTKQIQNTEQKVKLELLQGIPSHGAIPLLAGLKNTPIKNIATALETFDQVLNPSTMPNLGGQNFSLGNFFDEIPSGLLTTLISALPQEIGTSLQNLITLMPSETGVFSPPLGASTGSQINPNTFFTNAVNQLSNVTTFGELSNILQSLQTSSQSGMDQLPNQTQTLSTPFGDLIQIISPLGEITNQLSDIFKNAEALFSQLVTGISGVKFQNLLDPAGTQFSELINRFPQDIATELNSELSNFSQTVNQSFKLMQPFISNIDSGNLTVAGINFGSTIIHK